MHAHWLDDGAAIDAARLGREGVGYEHAPLGDHEALITRWMSTRGYVRRDEVSLAPTTPGLDTILARFDREHLHEDDEVRYVLAGEGIFDVRSRDDRWMRIVVQPGDLIVVPRDRHHRFLLTDARAIRCVRLFMDEAGWTPVYRAAAV